MKLHCIVLKCTPFWWTTLHLLWIQLQWPLTSTHSIHCPRCDFLFQPDIISITRIWCPSNVLAPNIHPTQSPILVSQALFHTFHTALHHQSLHLNSSLCQSISCQREWKFWKLMLYSITAIACTLGWSGASTACTRCQLVWMTIRLSLDCSQSLFYFVPQEKWISQLS